MAITYASNATGLFPAVETSATSWAQAMAGACTSGNTLVTLASGYINGATPNPTCSDGTNGSHTRAYFIEKVYGGEHLWAAVFYANTIAGATPTITVANGTATAGYGNADTLEYSPLATSPVDRTATNSGGGGVTALDSGTAAGAIAQADELLIGVVITDQAGVPASFTSNVSGSSPSSGWTEAFDRGVLVPATCGVTLINPSGTPTPIHKWTASVASDGGAWLGILVTLKGAAAAATVALEWQSPAVQLQNHHITNIISMRAPLLVRPVPYLLTTPTRVTNPLDWVHIENDVIWTDR